MDIFSVYQGSEFRAVFAQILAGFCFFFTFFHRTFQLHHHLVTVTVLSDFTDFTKHSMGQIFRQQAVEDLLILFFGGVDEILLSRTEQLFSST